MTRRGRRYHRKSESREQKLTAVPLDTFFRKSIFEVELYVSEADCGAAAGIAVDVGIDVGVDIQTDSVHVVVAIDLRVCTCHSV